MNRPAAKQGLCSKFEALQPAERLADEEQSLLGVNEYSRTQYHRQSNNEEVEQKAPFQKKSNVILGIDPGSQRTGYGIIQAQNGRMHHIASGALTNRSTLLTDLFEGLQAIVHQYNPTEAAIEQIFFYRNPRSALILGQARGVALLAVGLAKIPLTDYAARYVKQSIVGYGGATKNQIKQMVQRLLQLTKTPTEDAADALAIALCHAQCCHTFRNITQRTDVPSLSKRVMAPVLKSE